VSEYLKRFREMRNRCYNLTIGEKDLADLAFSGLSSYLREKMEGHNFVHVNQVLQRTTIHENRARDQRSQSQFRDNNTWDREKQGMNSVDEEASNDESDAGIYVAEWLDMPKNKSITCPFLKPISGQKTK
jgi:hypothetical protein